jgi:tetratricopeptide (TPR) repeat protein
VADHDRAIASLNEALRLDPEHADAYYARGLVFEIEERYDHSLADLKTVLRLEPSSWDELKLELDGSQAPTRVVRTGRFTEADLVSEQDGDNPFDLQATLVNLRLLPAHVLKGRRYRSRAREYLFLDHIGRVALKRGMAYAARGEIDQAIAAFKDVIDPLPFGGVSFRNLANPGNPPPDWLEQMGRLRCPQADQGRLLRAKAYCASGRFREAIADLAMVIRLDPPAVRLMLGSCYLEVGDYERASAELNAAIRLDCSNPHARFLRARTHHLQGQQDQAITDYTEALRLDPRMVPAYEGRAAAFRERGNIPQADADEHSAREFLRHDGQPPDEAE